MGKCLCRVIFLGYGLSKLSFNQCLQLSKFFVEINRKFSLNLQKKARQKKKKKRLNSVDLQKEIPAKCLQKNKDC